MHCKNDSSRAAFLERECRTLAPRLISQAPPTEHASLWAAVGLYAARDLLSRRTSDPYAVGAVACLVDASRALADVGNPPPGSTDFATVAAMLLALATEVAR